MHRVGTSYHLPNGGALYFDTGVVEMVTPAMELERAFPTARAVPFTVNGRYLRTNDVVDWPMIQP